MIAMRGDEVFVFFVFMAVAIAAIYMFLRFKLKHDKLQTIQRAIESGNMDDASRRALIDALASDARRTNEFWQSVMANAGRITQRILVTCGWLTFVISGFVLTGMLMTGAHRWDVVGALIGTGVGFALITLPLALREVEARRMGPNQP